jgi:hypothetical protein
MKLRGHRECLECGNHWSYFDTSSVTCPSCGSLRSQAIEQPGRRHTTGGATLDLAEALSAVDDQPLRTVASQAADACRSFLVERGFIAGGELQPLDDVTVAAAELRVAADRVKRLVDQDERAEWYLLELLRGAPTGERPDEVPAGFESVRGLAIADAVERYRTDVARYLSDQPEPAARRVLENLREHLRRVEALDGEVPVEHAERILEAARDISAYFDGDDAALARAEDRLSRL